VASSFVADTIRADDPCSSIYKNLFHINPPVRMGAADPSCTNPPFCKRTDLANLPADGFFAAGLTGQYVFVFPSADLVVARFASDVGGTEDWIAYSRKVLEGIFDAMDP
jgi:CubicO group peptidase (beta-lactamase class C family)